MRLFIAVDFDAYSEFFTQLQSSFRDIGTFTLPRAFHLTLKFLGDVSEDNITKIKESLSVVSFESFDARTTSFGVFPEEKYVRVLWLGLEPKEKIISLHKRIDDSLLSIFEKDERFHPHITLARVKAIRDRKKLHELLISSVEEKEQIINSFSLIKSVLGREGPTYETIETFQLS